MNRTQTTILILSALVLCGVSGVTGWFIKDYIYWRYDRVCVEPMTDEQLEKVYGQ